MWLQVEMKFRFKVVLRLMTYQPVSLENQFTQGKFAPVEVQLIFSLCINPGLQITAGQRTMSGQK